MGDFRHGSFLAGKTAMAANFYLQTGSFQIGYCQYFILVPAHLHKCILPFCRLSEMKYSCKGCKKCTKINID